MLRIAVQSKGRLYEDTMNLLAEADIKISNSKRTLLVQSSNFPIEVLYLRDDDIPQSVASGVADIGIVGENEFVERNEDAEIIDRLGFSKCRLSLAIPKAIEYPGVEWFNGKKIATSYPFILKKFMKEKGISTDIHVITGSVEISPGIGLADGIFDIVSSGLFLLVFGWFILLLMLIKWLEDLGGKSYKMVITQADDGEYVAKDGKRYNVIVSKDPNGVKDASVKGALYSSDRVGKGGKIFRFHKIRSMCPGAEAMKEQLLAYGINEADAPVFKLKNDPRVTKFGRFLRKMSLDELPQIWDIFVGNMSVIGPRSPLPNEVEKYNEYQMHRLDVKGGLLCLWQITHKRNELSFDEWIDLDIKYVESRSLWFDFKILIKGFLFVLADHSGE